MTVISNPTSKPWDLFFTRLTIHNQVKPCFFFSSFCPFRGVFLFCFVLFYQDLFCKITCFGWLTVIRSNLEWIKILLTSRMVHLDADSPKSDSGFGDKNSLLSLCWAQASKITRSLLPFVKKNKKTLKNPFYKYRGIEIRHTLVS